MPMIERDDARLYYEASGDGPAVVFAHGAGGNRLSWWQQTPFFESRYRVIRFDHRRFGRSTCPAEDFHPTHFAADLLAILDAEGIDHAALVCQSMGGWTGLPTALAAPERVSCLVLCDTPGGLTSPAILEAAAQVGRDASQEGIRGNRALAPDFPMREPALAHLYDQIAALNTGFEPAMLARLLDPAARIAPERLEGFAVPTLVVAGEHDQLFPAASLREVAALIPGARYEEFAGSGHSVYFEDAAAFNRVVDGFVAKHLAA